MNRKFDPGPIKVYEPKSHAMNFIDGVFTREECIAPAHIAHRSITPGHLGCVAQELGRKLHWDPENEVIKNDPEADKIAQIKDAFVVSRCGSHRLALGMGLKFRDKRCELRTHLDALCGIESEAEPEDDEKSDVPVE